VIDDILRANQAHAKDFAANDAPSRPTKQLVVLTCMDARLRPEEFLGLSLGSAHILRNAGAVVTDDVLRSLVLSTRLMGTKQVLVIGHTNCALEGVDEVELGERTRAGELQFHVFDDLEGHVQAQVQCIESSKLLPDEINVRGFVYQVEDGLLRQVV